MATWA